LSSVSPFDFADPAYVFVVLLRVLYIRPNVSKLMLLYLLHPLSTYVTTKT
jgi:hypothetical protein